MSGTCVYRALQEAQDIFGVDFDFEDFEQYGDEEEIDEEVSGNFLLFSKFVIVSIIELLKHYLLVNVYYE